MLDTSDVPGHRGNVRRAATCLLLLCGLPAAGKTTLAQALAQAAQQAGGVEAQRVSFDDFQPEAVRTRFDPAAWKAGRQLALSRISELLAERTQAAARAQPECVAGAVAAAAPPLLVIADDNMHLKSMRRQVRVTRMLSGACPPAKQARRLAAERGAAFQLLFVRCPAQQAMQLNAERLPSARVPPDAMQRMCQAFEAPSEAEVAAGALHTADATALRALGPHRAAARLLQGILAAWGEPQRLPSTGGMETQRAAGRAANAASALHQLDIATRAALAAAVAGAANESPQARSGLARELNAQRRFLLEEFRRGADGGAGAVDVAEQLLRTFEAAADEALVLIGMARLGVD